jgi:hypothetical protein
VSEIGVAWNITFKKNVYCNATLSPFLTASHGNNKKSAPISLLFLSEKELRDLFHFVEPELDSPRRGGNLCSGHENVAKSSGPFKWRG